MKLITRPTRKSCKESFSLVSSCLPRHCRAINIELLFQAEARSRLTSFGYEQIDPSIDRRHYEFRFLFTMLKGERKISVFSLNRSVRSAAARVFARVIFLSSSQAYPYRKPWGYQGGEREKAGCIASREASPTEKEQYRSLRGTRSHLERRRFFLSISSSCNRCSIPSLSRYPSRVSSFSRPLFFFLFYFSSCIVQLIS